jgi:hypothetical protein
MTAPVPSHRPLDEADVCPPGGEGYPVFVSVSAARHEAACDRATVEGRSLAALMRRALFDYLDQEDSDEH